VFYSEQLTLLTKRAWQEDQKQSNKSTTLKEGSDMFSLIKYPHMFRYIYFIHCTVFTIFSLNIRKKWFCWSI